MTEILTFYDCDFNDFKALMSDLRQKAVHNWNNGKQRTLFFFYYAGHGVMDNYTEAVCNGGERITKIRYPLEVQLKNLSYNKGTYVCAIFACCRVKLSKEMRGIDAAEH